MARKASFNFGANAKSKKSAGGKTKKGSKGGKSRGASGKGNAWRAYVGAPAYSSAPIPD